MFYRFLSLGLCVVAAPLAAHAQACIYRGDSADTRVADRSGEISTPFPDSLSAGDCRRLRVVTGAVTVYTLAQDRRAMARRVVEVGGGPLVAGRGSSDADDASPGMLQQIRVVLEGGQRLKTGSSRGSGEDYLQAALPSGLLAQPADDLVIVLGQQPDAQLTSLDLTVNGKTVLRQKGAASELRLPAWLLPAGSKVSWTLVYGGQARQGNFQVVPAEQLSTLVARLDQDSTVEDPTLRQLGTAAALVQAGFVWDARDCLRLALLR